MRFVRMVSFILLVFSAIQQGTGEEPERTVEPFLLAAERTGATKPTTNFRYFFTSGRAAFVVDDVTGRATYVFGPGAPAKADDDELDWDHQVREPRSGIVFEIYKCKSRQIYFAFPDRPNNPSYPAHYFIFFSTTLNPQPTDFRPYVADFNRYELK